MAFLQRSLIFFLWFLFLGIAGGGVAWGGAARAEPLVADLSKHLVAITTGFSGAEVLLFGAVEEIPGSKKTDVVVVVRGPNRSEAVRHKDQRMGIWLNTTMAKMVDIPSFYRVAATRPLEQIARREVLRQHQIGLDSLDIDIKGKKIDNLDLYRTALIRLKQQNGLYGKGVQDISFLGQRLFRTDVYFPANIPVGTYLVEVYLFADGEVVSAQTTPLVISKIGTGADVYDFAQQQPAAYGIIAIALAVLAGWIAAVAFRK